MGAVGTGSMVSQDVENGWRLCNRFRWDLPQRPDARTGRDEMKSRLQQNTVHASIVLLAGLSLLGCSDSDSGDTGGAAGNMAMAPNEMESNATDGSENAGAEDHSMHPPEQNTMMGDTMMADTMMGDTVVEHMDPPGLGTDATAGHPELEPTFTNIFENILTKAETGNCMAATCHGGEPSPMSNGNFQIVLGDQETTYNNLVNAESTSDMCGELGMKLVEPGDAFNSLLMIKLFEDPPCGARMPVGPALQDTQVNQILEWIDMGALND